MIVVNSIAVEHIKSSTQQPIPAPYFHRGDGGGRLIATADSLTEGDIIRVV